MKIEINFGWLKSGAFWALLLIILSIPTPLILYTTSLSSFKLIEEKQTVINGEPRTVYVIEDIPGSTANWFGDKNDGGIRHVVNINNDFYDLNDTEWDCYRDEGSSLWKVIQKGRTIRTLEEAKINLE